MARHRLSLTSRVFVFRNPGTGQYDIRGGVRGKYYERYRQCTNVVLLEPDIAADFHHSESVNRALRMLIDLARVQVDDPARSG